MKYTDENIAWLVQEVHNLAKQVMNHKTAINELGEKEYIMSVEFDAAKVAFETYQTNVKAAVSALHVKVSDFTTQVEALTTTVVQLTTEVNTPHEDTAHLVALAEEIAKATSDLAAAVA